MMLRIPSTVQRGFISPAFFAFDARIVPLIDIMRHGICMIMANGRTGNQNNINPKLYAFAPAISPTIIEIIGTAIIMINDVNIKFFADLELLLFNY